MRPTYSEITCEDMASYLWCLSIHPGNIYRKGWTDATTPRTERPVRFNAGLHQYVDAGFGRLRATYRYSPSFTYRA